MKRKSIEEYIEEYTGYTRNIAEEYPSKDIVHACTIKREHSLRVLGYMQILIEKANLHHYSRELQIGALFHDIGRYMQFVQYSTFNDELSCNHGFLGVRIAKEHAFFREEESLTQKRIYAMIALHNSYIVPSKLSIPIQAIVNAIRDCDRIDIFHTYIDVLQNKDTAIKNMVLLNKKDEPSCYSPNILESLQQRTMGKYSNLVYYNDVQLLFASWIYNFTYPSSIYLLPNTIVDILLGNMLFDTAIQKEYTALQEYINTLHQGKS